MNDKLSVVIITKNEEQKIARCLESVKWADEIIIIDDCSSDGTTQICKSFGATVIENASYGNFDYQRNLGIEKASGDWILQMDADEIVTEELAREIKKAIGNPGRFVAYKFKRRNYFLGHFMKYGGWYSYSTKLSKKTNARFIGKSVHETLHLDGETGIISEDIEHFPFTSIYQFIDRHNYYTAVEARGILEKEGMLDMKIIRYNLTIKPFKLLWKMYVKKSGFREGMHGFIFSVMYSFVHFLKWAKYWELTYGKKTA